MSAFVWGGPVHRSLRRDEEGHRFYIVKHLVKTTSTQDGPAMVMVATGLPVIGAFWDYGNDLDGFAICTPAREVEFYGPNQHWPGYWWIVTSHFQTKMDTKRCQDTNVEDPLLEPDRISGSYLKFTRQVRKDRHDELINNSSGQPITGALTEFDDNRPLVCIEQNVADLELPLFNSMIDTVNDSTLWGVGPRKVKLCHASWTRELYGVCSFFFKRRFEFEVNDRTFDRKALDEGTKVLNGRWNGGSWEEMPIKVESPPGSGIYTDIPTDPKNPMHYVYYQDKDGQNSKIPLDGTGKPLDDSDALVYRDIEHYDESNFLLLGIPSVLV